VQKERAASACGQPSWQWPEMEPSFWCFHFQVLTSNLPPAGTITITAPNPSSTQRSCSEMLQTWRSRHTDGFSSHNEARIRRCAGPLATVRAPTALAAIASYDLVNRKMVSTQHGQGSSMLPFPSKLQPRHPDLQHGSHNSLSLVHLSILLVHISFPDSSKVAIRTRPRPYY
jgi:hypothetical protein